MGDIIPFQRRRPQNRRVKRRSISWRAARPLLLLVVLVVGWFAWRTPDLLRLPDLFSTDPQLVEARWGECGGAPTSHCVQDGDTFYIGRTSYRVVGIDAPERDARCPREARLAAEARIALVEWLNRGPFWMRGRFDKPTDRYGRELRELYRKDEAGMRAYVGTELIEQGLARRYHGGERSGWC